MRLAPTAPWQRWDAAAALLCLGFFAAAVYFRQRWVGGCDAWAYYAEAQNLLGRPIGLEPYPEMPEPRAQMPLCIELAGGKPTSFFPPGFPLLLAASGLLHAEFLLNPALGALTGWMIHLTARAQGAPYALFATAIWLSNLLVFWGSTQVMSDLPAASALTLSHLLLTRGSPALAGGVAGLALAVRPTNLLFCFILPWLCEAARERWRLAAGLLGALTAIVLWHFARFGLVLPPYFANTGELGFAATGHQLRFFAVHTTRLFWIAFPFAAIAAVRAPGRSAFYLAWFGAFVAFYVLWVHPLEHWWWTRFLLPAVPALVLLAAEGARITAEVVRPYRAGRMLPTLASVLIAVFAATSFRSRAATDVLRTDIDRHYYEDALRTQAIVEPGAVVGAVNQTGPLRLYAGIPTFSWHRPGALTILEWAVDLKRPVYLLIDDLERDTSPNAGAFGDRFLLQKVEVLPSGKPIYRVREHRHRVVLEIGTAAARPHLVSGWSGDERAGETPFAWTLGHEAIVRAPLKPRAAYRMRFRAGALAGLTEPQTLSLEAGGRQIATVLLQPGMAEYEVHVPAAPEDGLLTFHFSAARSPAEIHGSADTRPLAAAFERIAFVPEEDERSQR